MKTLKFIILFFIIVSSFSISAQTKKKFLDVRDGKVYNTIIVGNKTWFTQNLNFIVANSWCYDDKEENCEKYGRLYDWDMVMNGSEEVGAQGICPDGWHVSTYEEWQSLIEEFKKTKDLLEGGMSGFDLKFGGCRFPNGDFEFLDMAATFWTSNKDDKDGGKYVYTFYAYKDKANKSLISYSTNKTYGQYLRCVKD